MAKAVLGVCKSSVTCQTLKVQELTDVKKKKENTV